MIRDYKTKSTSSNTAKVEDIIISETSNTRRIMRPQIIENNPKNPAAGIKVALIHQKKSGEVWEEIKDKSLSELKAGEMAKLILGSEETLKLYTELSNLYAIHSQNGVTYGENRLIVGSENEIIRTDPQGLFFIKKLIEKGHSREIWQQLTEVDPDLATKLSYARLHQFRHENLRKFNIMLGEDTSEQDWQSFFEVNKWIFGYGLNYQILNPVTVQANYGGERVTGKGKNKGDFLSATQGTIKFTVLIEIKKPSSVLVEPKQYRNDVHCVGIDVLGGVSQLRGNAHLWQVEGSATSGNRDALETNLIYTVQPKKILIVGTTAQLVNRSMRESFELFRRNQSDIEVLTFDEIYERAKYIIDQSEPEQVAI